MMRVLCSIVLAILFVSCSSKRDSAQPSASSPVQEVNAPKEANDTTLFYSRGACFGMCPIFELTVLKDGRAFYLGKNHVDRIGRFQAQVSFSDLELVRLKAKEIGYFQMKAVYDNNLVHDLPDITTALAHEGKLHWVRNRYKGPATLRMLYIEMDSLVERQDWRPVSTNNKQ